MGIVWKHGIRDTPQVLGSTSGLIAVMVEKVNTMCMAPTNSHWQVLSITIPLLPEIHSTGVPASNTSSCTITSAELMICEQMSNIQSSMDRFECGGLSKQRRGLKLIYAEEVELQLDLKNSKIRCSVRKKHKLMSDSASSTVPNDSGKGLTHNSIELMLKYLISSTSHFS
jgi:hypothetical protein